MFNKIKSLFVGVPTLKSRKEIILDKLNLPFAMLILKYDFALLNPVDLFSKEDGMRAMTILPNGNKLISYSSGILKVSNQTYKYFDYSINHMIAISNEEIIVTNNIYGDFRRINFINNKLITRYRDNNIIKYIEKLSDQRFFTYSAKGIKIWTYDGDCLYTIKTDHIVSFKVISFSHIYFRTYTGQLKVCNSNTGECKIMYDKYPIISNDAREPDTIKIHKSYYPMNDFDIYQLSDERILCDNIIFDGYKMERLFYEGSDKNTAIISGKCVFVSCNGVIRLFNYKTHLFEAQINDFFNIKEIIALPDDKIAFITFDTLRIYDFEIQKFITNIYISKLMNDTELSIKLKLLY